MAPKSRTGGTRAQGKGKGKAKAQGKRQAPAAKAQGEGKGKGKAQAKDRGTKRGAEGGSKSTGPSSKAGEAVTINRAPVLCLWVCCCMECCGYERGTALTIGKVASTMGAVAKAGAMGKTAAKAPPGKRAETAARGTEDLPPAHEVHIGHWNIRLTETDKGLRAIDAKSGEPMESEPIEEYLQRSLGDNLETVRTTMLETAKSYPKKELPDECMKLYNKFRPGSGGWGERGQLMLDAIRGQAKK